MEEMAHWLLLIRVQKRRGKGLLSIQEYILECRHFGRSVGETKERLTGSSKRARDSP